MTRRYISDAESRFGEALLELGLITRDEFATAVVRGTEDERGLVAALLSVGAVSEELVAKALAQYIGAEQWHPVRGPVHGNVVSSFPSDLALDHRIFPVAKKRNASGLTWWIATSDPPDEDVEERIQAALCPPEQPTEVIWLVATRTVLEDAIRAHYGTLGSPDDSSPQR